MPTIDTSYVRQELRAISDCSNAVKTLLREALEQLESDPSCFEPLVDVPARITEAYPSVTLRKIKLQSGRHNFRLIAAHWARGAREDHVDILYAFRRQDGYPIDWDWVDEILS